MVPKNLKGRPKSKTQTNRQVYNSILKHRNSIAKNSEVKIAKLQNCHEYEQPPRSEQNSNFKNCETENV